MTIFAFTSNGATIFNPHLSPGGLNDAQPHCSKIQDFGETCELMRVDELCT